MITAVLAAGREAAERTMLDTCTVREPGAKVWDPATGDYTDLPGAVVYTGRCAVKRPTVEDVQAGDREVAQRTYRVKLPASVATVQVGHICTVTESTDEMLQDHPLVVTAVELGSTRTARWLTVEDRHGG